MTRLDWLTDEHVRILYAVEQGRLFVNAHGRYEIDGEVRPDRKCREQLQRRGLIAKGSGTRRDPWRLTARGVTTVKAVHKARVDRFVAERERLIAGGMDFADAHLQAAGSLGSGA